MVVNLNPQIAISSKPAFKQNVNTSFTADNSTTAPQSAPAQKPVTGFLSKVAYAWINLSEGTKGVIKGILGGFAVGTTIAAIDKFKSLFKKTEGVTFLQKLNVFKNPTKGLGKLGKVVAPIAAGVVFIANIISARLTANKRTANVDHQLYEGHRDK